MTRIAVVSAGLSVPSSTRLLAERLAAATAAALDDAAVNLDIEHVDLRDHAHELIDHTLLGFAPPALAAAIERVTAADALIAVTPIYSASYSGLFKMFFDVLDKDALAGKPTLVAATGGTARHSLALEHAVRPLFAYLRAVVVPTAVFAAPEDWGGGPVTPTSTSALGGRVERAGTELAALVAGKPATPERDPFADPVPFAALLDT